VGVAAQRERVSELTVVVKPKEDGEQDGKGDGSEYVPEANVPELDQPAGAVGGRRKGLTGRQVLEPNVAHLANVHEAGEENNGERGAVILQEDADGVGEEVAPAQLAADVSDEEDEQGDDDGQVKGLLVAEPGQDLDALLKVYKGDVEAKHVAGKAGDVAQPVARVGNSQDPVKDQRPARMWLVFRPALNLNPVRMVLLGRAGVDGQVNTHSPIQHMKAR
jgi:hypothetical protein